MREVDLANRQDSAATGETAAFTLMGVRYYNWVTGTFTSPDSQMPDPTHWAIVGPK